MSVAEEVTTRGAEWFDQVYPEWYTMINQESLDLNSATNCVAGQILKSDTETGYGVLIRMAQATFPRSPEYGDWIAMHGFVPMLRKHLHHFEINGTFTWQISDEACSPEELQASWIRRVEERMS